MAEEAGLEEFDDTSTFENKAALSEVRIVEFVIWYIAKNDQVQAG